MTAAADERTYRIPDAPSLGGSVKAALMDFYYNSWRMVPANLLWGLGLLGVLFLLFTMPVAAVPATIFLAVPAVGIFRLATQIVREEPVSFRDSLHAWRRFLGRALISGAVLIAISFVMLFNAVLALLYPELVLWVIATMSVWGLLAIWVVAVPYWALLTDPVREAEPLRAKLRLAAVLVLVSPLRFSLLLILIVLVLVTSAIFFAALLTISVAFVALLATRYTLPAADRLERRETMAVLE